MRSGSPSGSGRRVAFKLGGVRLRSAHGFGDEEQARLLPRFWAALPPHMIGGNANGKNLYEAVVAATAAIGSNVSMGWRMLANLERLGAFTKPGRFEWRKSEWPRQAVPASFAFLRPWLRRKKIVRCPHCRGVIGSGKTLASLIDTEAV